jgi:hypothetical protein
MNIKEFREMGLLQEINRLFLHPIGLALEITLDETKKEILSGIWDYRNDPEGILFAKGLINPEKIQRIKKFIDKQHKKRKKTIGYVIQTEKSNIPSDPSRVVLSGNKFH